jgi:peptidoglycan/xylan/chitin deacetylase (PgdA/CDA1 family)
VDVDFFEQVSRFWKPMVAPHELSGLASFGDLTDPPSPGIRVLRPDSDPRCYSVMDAGTRIFLFAAVQAIEEPPEAAEVLAEIRDVSGRHYSFLLWYPKEKCVVVPFDPNAAVESLRLERYIADSQKTVLPSSILSAYYVFKPALPASVRMQLRKLLARHADAGEQYLSWPFDQSLDLLMQMLLRVAMLASGRESMPFIWFWPDRHPWAAVLTHDVETAEGLRLIPRVMDIERARGLRSSFNFVARDYEVGESLLKEVRDSGFEIGVHGYRHDGLMFARRSTFLKRVAVINDYGRRWGAAGFRSPATYRNLEWFDDLEFEYDSSVTDVARYEPQPGGCASIFPYDIGRITELPMTMPQDHTLFSVLGHTDSRVWLAKLECIRRAHGMACVLTHPDPRAGYIGRPEPEAHYREVLDVLAESEAWTPLPRDLVRWWKARAAADPGRVEALQGAATGSAVIEGASRLRIVPPAFNALGEHDDESGDALLQAAQR